VATPDDEEGQVVRIPIVQESEATGELADLYDEVRETFGIGFVPDVFKLVSTRPDFMRPLLAQYQAMFQGGVLSRDIKELIATVVSTTNSCHY
jgi:alkylhydroperoxidase family enzyme